MSSIAKRIFRSIALLLAISGLQLPNAAAAVGSHFAKIKDDPVLLRQFLLKFPKGGELHTHLDGAIYAENYIRWAADDGKCIDLASFTVFPAPCDPQQNKPAVADIQFNPDRVNAVIDAFSVRNYERGPVSGHDQFFSTFARYRAVSEGRQGSMLAAVTARASRQNIRYLEIMVSYGMDQARALASDQSESAASTTAEDWLNIPAMPELVKHTVRFTDRVLGDWRQELGCELDAQAAGCEVEVRFIAQVIRGFPLNYVAAQTVLAFSLVQQDPRFVGVNFVAPEDAPLTLRDYEQQMKLVAQTAAMFPELGRSITLHAGELAYPLVPPRDMRNHIFQAVHLAGADRIGHGVDIIHEDNASKLLAHMASSGVLVEINLTSNEVILGVEGDNHPFNLYRQAGVPLALSTDDEGVSRIDLTHEYQRAVQTYDLSYAEIKELSRNVLEYSFLPGQSLFSEVSAGKRNKDCRRDRFDKALSTRCGAFLQSSERAGMQWQLEHDFAEFESQY